MYVSTADMDCMKNQFYMLKVFAESVHVSDIGC